MAVSAERKEQKGSNALPILKSSTMTNDSGKRIDLSALNTGLLKFCLEHSDGRNLVDTPLPARDPADYAWLKQAFNDLQTDADRMKKLIQVIQDSNSEFKQKLASLEELEFLLEDLDNANDFHKFGGVAVCLSLLRDSNPAFRRYGASLVGLASQNNPFEKQFFVVAGVFPLLLSTLAQERVKDVLSKLLSAVSALVDNDPELQQQFLEAGGIAHLGIMVAHNDPSTKAKALYLMNKLALVNPRVSDDVQRLDLLELILELINVSHDDVRHRATTLLNTLVQQSSRVLEAARLLGLRAKVQSATDNAQGEDWDPTILQQLLSIA